MAAPLTIGLFGPIRVLVGDAPMPRLRSRKALWLLGLMTLRNGRPVQREWIASTLWPDSDLTVAFANLRPVICELRRALGNQAYRLQSPDRVTVQLDLSGADVDLVEFDAAVAKGDYERAVAMYQGPLLEGCLEEWVPQERNAREQDCAKALQRLGEVAYEAGDYTKAMDHYRRLILLDPWRDASRRGLMKSLAKSGDINAALQTFRDFAQVLRNEGGMSPDEKTTALYHRLRTLAQEGGRRARIEAPDQRRAMKVVGRLPHALTALIGREDERLEVAAALRQHRLVTLLGPGGIGKTRLATEVASEVVGEYPDGAWLVSLEALAGDHLVVGHLLSTLEIAEQPGRPSLSNLTEALRQKRLLLVLDNCEHLLAPVVGLCSHLLRECGEIRILATSRESIGLLGEKVWPVPTLAVPDPAHLPQNRATLLRVLASYESIQLFVDRAQAVNPSFILSAANAPAVAQICARLEGVPLAIELAAARIRSMTAGQVAARLEDHLRLLTGGDKGASSRQRTLRATLDWSYELLNRQERTLFHRLSVFAGGWTLDAAENVCTGDSLDEGNISDLHGALVDKSIVSFDEKQGRFRFLETMRQYAAERLQSVGEVSQLEDRHRVWCLAAVKVAEPALIDSDQTRWLPWFQSEEDNFRKALDSSVRNPQDGLILSGSLSHFWKVRGQFEEGRRRISEALGRVGAEGVTEERAKALYALSMLAGSIGADADALEAGEECLAIRESIGNEDKVATSLARLGILRCARGEYAASNAHFEGALAIRKVWKNPHEEATILMHHANSLSGLCEFDRVRERLETAMAIFIELGDHVGQAGVLNNMGENAAIRGDYAAARLFYERRSHLVEKLRFPQFHAWGLDRLSRILVELGLFHQVEEMQEESLRIYREAGNLLGVAISLLSASSEALRRGSLSKAEALIREGLELLEGSRHTTVVAEATEILAEVLLARGDRRAARELHHESLLLRKAIGDRYRISDSLEGIAAANAEERPMETARLLGAAERNREEIGTPRPPSRRSRFEIAVDRARSCLGPPVFSNAWNEGCGMGWQKAVECALATNDDGSRS